MHSSGGSRNSSRFIRALILISVRELTGPFL